MNAYMQFLKVFTKDFHLLVPFFSASLRSRSNICSNARSLTNFDRFINLLQSVLLLHVRNVEVGVRIVHDVLVLVRRLSETVVEDVLTER